MFKILCTNCGFTKEEIELAKEKDLELIPFEGGGVRKNFFTLYKSVMGLYRMEKNI